MLTDRTRSGNERMLTVIPDISGTYRAVGRIIEWLRIEIKPDTVGTGTAQQVDKVADNVIRCNPIIRR